MLGRVRRNVSSQSDLKEVLYGYITGPAFIEHVKAVVESLTRMRDQLGHERSALERIWSKRDQEILRMAAHLSRMVGDLEGIGIALPVPGRVQSWSRADPRFRRFPERRPVWAPMSPHADAIPADGSRGGGSCGLPCFYDIVGEAQVILTHRWPSRPQDRPQEKPWQFCPPVVTRPTDFEVTGCCLPVL